jgi:hypothetical protein
LKLCRGKVWKPESERTLVARAPPHSCAPRWPRKFDPQTDDGRRRRNLKELEAAHEAGTRPLLPPSLHGARCAAVPAAPMRRKAAVSSRLCAGAIHLAAACPLVTRLSYRRLDAPWTARSLSLQISRSRSRPRPRTHTHTLSLSPTPHTQSQTCRRSLAARASSAATSATMLVSSPPDTVMNKTDGLAEVCSSSERLCYNCKQPGHESNGCPHPRTTESTSPEPLCCPPTPHVTDSLKPSSATTARASATSRPTAPLCA